LIPTIGDPKANVGRFVLTALQQPEKTLPGRVLVAAMGETSTNDMVKQWSAASGKEAVFMQVSLAEYEGLFGAWGTVEGPMFKFYDDFSSALLKPGEHVLDGGDLGMPFDEVKGFPEWLVDEIKAEQ
jgi:hypothetical protein